MSKSPLIRDIMTENKFSIQSDMAVYDALDFLIAKKVSGIPVIDDGDKLVGFLTEKDCLRLQANAHQYNMTGRTVRDIMSSITEALQPSFDLLSAATVFLRCNFTTLPVMDGEHLVGSVTRQSIIHAVQQWHHTRGMEHKLMRTDQALMDHPSSIEEIQNLVGKSNNEQLASVLGKRHQ